MNFKFIRIIYFRQYLRHCIEHFVNSFSNDMPFEGYQELWDYTIQTSIWLSGITFPFFGFSIDGRCVLVCHTYTLVQLSAKGSSNSVLVKYFNISLSWNTKNASLIYIIIKIRHHNRVLDTSHYWAQIPLMGSDPINGLRSHYWAQIRQD